VKGQQNRSLLISTDRKTGFLKAMETYQLRWGIKVFFRDCKQNLALGRCQSKDLDAQIADTSIVLMNYIVLALKKRFGDYETLGGLFRRFKEIMLQKTLVQKIWALLISLFDSLFAGLGIEWQAFIRRLIYKQNLVMEEVRKNFNELFSNTAQLAEN
jgi:RNAse (barnase) inhibitor barstar